MCKEEKGWRKKGRGWKRVALANWDGANDVTKGREVWKWSSRTLWERIKCKIQVAMKVGDVAYEEKKSSWDGS